MNSGHSDEINGEKGSHSRVCSGVTEFDKFIEKGDEKLQLDTGTRETTGAKISSTLGVDLGDKNVSRSKGNVGSQPISPQRISETDHPLKKDPSPQSKTKVMRSNTMMKRRSLIKPMVFTATPDPVEDDVVTNAEKRIVSNHSRAVSDVSDSSFRKPTTNDSGTESETTSDINLLLQSLASKELDLLDSKHHLEEMRRQLSIEEQAIATKEKELQELKQRVSKLLNPNGPSTQSNDVLKVVEPNSNIPASSNNALTVASSTKNQSNQNHPDTSASFLWKNPLAYFNHLDKQMQRELNRSLNWDDTSYDGDSSFQNDNQSNNADQLQYRKNAYEKNYRQQQHQHQQQISISDSLWNFVTDVKNGLIGVDEEHERQLSRGNAQRRVQRSAQRNAAAADPRMRNFKTGKLDANTKNSGVMKNGFQRHDDANTIKYDDENDLTLRSQAAVVEMKEF